MNQHESTACPGTPATAGYMQVTGYTPFRDNDASLRQHCLELAVKRLADASVATAVYEKNAIAVAKEYYDFIKGTQEGKLPDAPKPLANSFEANVEPASEPNVSRYIVEKLIDGAVKAFIREGEYKKGPLSVRSTVTEMDHGTACEIHVDVQYQFTGFNFKTLVATK